MTVLKAKIGDKELEIWFAPSFSIKTNSKELELMLRSVEMEVFDPWELRFRKVKATRNIIDAYLIIENYKLRVPEMKITIEQAPELPNSFDQGTEFDPVEH